MFLHAYAVRYILDCGVSIFLVLSTGGPDKSSPVPGRWGVLCPPVWLSRLPPPAFCSRTPLQDSGKAISHSRSLPTTSRFLLGHQKHNSMNY